MNSVFCSCTLPYMANQLFKAGTKLVPLPAQSNLAGLCSVSLPVNHRENYGKAAKLVSHRDKGLILRAKILAKVYFY